MPQIGSDFITVDYKKEAEAILAERKQSIYHTMKFEKINLPFVPLLIKVDML